ncbi:MAG: NAD(P)H-hydrate dehydratase [Lachnospiraceae bacterium]|nr:NAD(P)H-hydrate dehydratase [Lachnospiraceae bacterium]
MRLLPTAGQMQEMDRYTIEEIGIPSMVLMERAALRCLEVMQRKELDLSATLILCGTGNNGGDGFALARLLHQQGYKPTVCRMDGHGKFSIDCKTQRDICENLKIKIVDFAEIADKNFTVIVDAVFGIGLCRNLDASYIQLFFAVNKKQGVKVAMDVPSGICSTSGRLFGIAFQADITVTFQCAKRGLLLFPANVYAGEVVVVDIGIDLEKAKEDVEINFTYALCDISKVLPKRVPNSHKGSYGKVLMICGSVGMAGASFLSAKAAYGMGAGLVQVYTAQECQPVIQTLLPEAIVSTYQNYEVAKLNELLHWADVLCIGCGLGKSLVSESILTHVLQNFQGSIIIDADAVHLLKNQKELLHNLKHPCILTPHIKEMANFLEISLAELQENIFAIITEFVREYGVICVLKDARTVVAQKGKKLFINTSGNNAMAKGGSGDVLAGMLTGLLAQSSEDFYEMVCLGVYLHGLCGDKAKSIKSSYGVFASDLIDMLGEIINENT